MTTPLPTNVEITTTPVPLQRLAQPFGTYAGLAWLPQGLVVQSEALTPPTISRLYWLAPDGTLGDQIPIPDEQGCMFFEARRPMRLPDSRLGFIGTCINSIESGLPDKSYLRAFDLNTNTITPLLDSAMPTENAGGGIFAWAPDMQLAFATDGGRLATKLYWFTPGTRDITKFPTRIPLAAYVDWSPDGSTIAWDGAPGSANRGVTSALSAPYNLYLMEPDGSNLRPIVTSYHNPAGLAWSPDGRWLVLIANFDGHTDAAWLIDPQTGSRRMLAAGDFQWPAWSPDGSQLALVATDNRQFGPNCYLVILDTSALDSTE